MAVGAVGREAIYMADRKKREENRNGSRKRFPKDPPTVTYFLQVGPTY
jgi:hypothetical protein